MLFLQNRLKVTHQSGASIEYSPVEALKRVCEKQHIVYIGDQTVLLSIVHIDKQTLLAIVLSVMSTVHSVPIISLGERLYYLAVLSYTFFNILIRIQPGQ